MNRWDVPPPGLENKTALEVKQMNIFPLSPLGFVPQRHMVAQFRPFPFAAHPHAHSHPHAHGEGRPPLLLPPAPNLGPSPGFSLAPPPGTLTAVNEIPRGLRRIYVGNLPEDTKEDEIAEFFNVEMIKAEASKFERPVISVQLVPEKAYAFLDFRTPEEATAGMAFDGVTFKTNALKVRRPKDYVPIGPESDTPKIHVPGAIATNVADGPNKVFIGNIPTYFTEEQVKGLLILFGDLKSFHLVKDPSSSQSKGFAFCEFISTEVTDAAIAGLNGMQVGEKQLLVQRASVGARNKDGVYIPANAPVIRPPFPMAPGLNPNLMPLGTPQLPAVRPVNPSEATRVLQLLNMVAPEELVDDDEYEDIYEDVKEECSKYGKVLSLEIPRPIAGEDMPGVGKIFVEFEDTAGCMAALQALSGRKFASRTVVTSFFPEEKYYNRDF